MEALVGALEGALVGALEGALVGALVGAGSTRGGTGGGCWNTLISRKKSLSHQLKVLSSNLSFTSF